MNKKIKIRIVMSFLLLILIISFVIVSLNREPIENEREFCTEESRDIEACIEIYQPVCGYDINQNKIQTFSNSCFACIDENVKYYIEGECL